MWHNMIFFPLNIVTYAKEIPQKTFFTIHICFFKLLRHAEIQQKKKHFLASNIVHILLFKK
jgi:hypothetical protein